MRVSTTASRRDACHVYPAGVSIVPTARTFCARTRPTAEAVGYYRASLRDVLPSDDLLSLQSLRPAQGKDDSLRQPFDHRQVPVVKRKRTRRKHLKQSDEIAFIQHRRP